MAPLPQKNKCLVMISCFMCVLLSLLVDGSRARRVKVGKTLTLALNPKGLYSWPQGTVPVDTPELYKIPETGRGEKQSLAKMFLLPSHPDYCLKLSDIKQRYISGTTAKQYCI